MSLVSRIKDLCDSKSISLDTLSKELGFGAKALYKWDNNSPSGDKLQKVADYFNISVDELINGAPRGKLAFLLRSAEELTSEDQEEIGDMLELLIKRRRAKNNDTSN